MANDLWTLIALISAILVVLNGVCGDDFILSDEDLRLYVKELDKLEEYDIITPALDYSGRYKRESPMSTFKKLTFSAFEDDYEVHLTKSEELFRPDLEVEYVYENTTVKKEPLTNLRESFFQGFAVSHNFSLASFTIFNGSMYGFINQGEKGLFIAPLQSDHAHEYSKRRKRQADKPPHLVYKLKNRNSSSCDNDDVNEVVRNENPQHSLEQSVGSGHLPKYMEIFLMLDLDFYQKNSPNEAAYAVAIMHVVSRRFAEPSLDVSLKLYIVRVVILMTDSPTLDGHSFFVQSEGASLVEDLCTWSSIVNPPNGFSGHWDNLVLLSGKDLFSFFSGSGLLGRVRSLDGTCEVGQECSINEDIGLSAGLVVAHEIGHTLTLSHDSLVGCGSNGFVMNSFIGVSSNSFRWSTCSRSGLQMYLQSPASFCMDDVPIGYEALPVVNLPGQVYSLDEQCDLAFPSGATACDFGPVDCLSLLCDEGFGCGSSFRSTAEGTPCNANGTMICLDGECVEATLVPVPVDGGWSEWVEHECSRTCDCGIRSRERECNNPVPFWGGAPCEGPSAEYQFCNTNVSCGNTDDDFRNEQCAESNQYPFPVENYFWFSYFGSFIPDFLYCQNPCYAPQLHHTEAISRPPFTNIDGTGCWDYGMEDWNKLFKCIGGTCEQFGCDGVLHGSKVFDDCLICNGDGTSCDCVSNNTDVAGTIGKFNNIITIPARSTVVFIQNEYLMDGNHIAIVGEDGGYYFQGTGALPALDLRASRGTTTIVHDYNSMYESFFAVGPIHEELTIRIYLSVLNDTSVSYQYCTPKQEKTFYWDICEWSECSATCNGTQTRNVDCACVEDGIKSYTPDEDCVNNGIGPKPAVARQCNGATCPEWVAGPLSECDVTCGTGNQMRVVECLLNGTVVPDFLCNLNDKPEPVVQCEERECIPGCGIIIDAIQGSPVGTITSPYFPNDYPSDVRCSTYIFAEPGYQIKLFFGQFSLQSSPEDDCPTDRLEITNLVSCTTEVICGTNSNFTRILDNAVLMDLVTNEVDNASGFKLSYTLL